MSHDRKAVSIPDDERIIRHRYDGLRARGDVDAGSYLDQVALAAAGGAISARVALIGIVDEHRLARPAITKLLIDPADIDDAQQLALIAVAERIGGYEGRGPFLGWLHRVARNEALMLLRRKQRRNEPSGEEPPEQWGFVARLSSFVADADAVERLLAGLSHDHREALRLREIEGLDYEEIAARLGVPVGTVRSRLARARDQLARQARVW
jgi:RNA polymerase sigma-70 factor (ECF subfamily)